MSSELLGNRRGFPIKFAGVSLLAVMTVLAVHGGVTTHARSTGAVSGCLSPTDPTIRPPAGFSPLLASAVELHCYGFPQRPSDPEAAQHWSYLMAHALHYVPANPGRPGNYRYDWRVIPAPSRQIRR